MNETKTIRKNVRLFFQFFANIGLPSCNEIEKLTFRRKKKKSHRPSVIFKFFTTTPNLISNFENHKNIGKTFDYMYRFMYTLSMHHKGINIIEGYFGYQK